MTANEPDDYYPWRWRVADAVEDLFLLHRGRLLAILGIGAVAILAIVLLSSDAEDDVVSTSATTENPATTATPGLEETTVAPDQAEQEAASTTTATSSTTTTTSSTTTTTTAAPTSLRAATSAEQLAATEAGAIINLSTTQVTLSGGLPDDDTADQTLALAEGIFPNLTVVDSQVVDESFAAPERVTLRLAAADLFGYNSDDLNPTYLPIIDQIAAALVADDSWQVEVSGHTDDTGPAAGNQRLSEGRAASAAARLQAQGVPSDRITSIGRGESEPIASNGTEAGRLANRRVEFTLSQ